jgi:peptidoglycan/xylan/chitin deacetylase (PgdA/CDA1 family)
MPELKMAIKRSVGRFAGHGMRFPGLARSYPMNRINIILMYHRVLDSPPEGFHDPALYVTAKTFEMHLREVARVFGIVPLEDLIRPDRHEKARTPLCAVTFDDAWNDTYQVAFPILRKHGVPASVFVPTGLIGEGSGFWFEDLTDLANKAVENGIVSAFLQYFHGLVGGWSPEILSLESLSDLISRLKELPAETLPGLVSRAYGELGLALKTRSHTIGWEDMREMSNHGISFGPHGCNHLILTTLTGASKRQEIFNSLAIMGDKRIGLHPVFSFPNGSWDGESIRYLMEAGYVAAVTTRRGFNTSATCPFLLNRIGLHEYISDTPDLLWFSIFQSILAGSKSLRKGEELLDCCP